MGCRCTSSKSAITPKTFEQEENKRRSSSTAQREQEIGVSVQNEIINAIPVNIGRHGLNEADSKQQLESLNSPLGHSDGGKVAKENNSMRQGVVMPEYKKIKNEAVTDYKENSHFNSIVWSDRSEELD